MIVILVGKGNILRMTIDYVLFIHYSLLNLFILLVAYSFVVEKENTIPNLREKPSKSNLSLCLFEGVLAIKISSKSLMCRQHIISIHNKYYVMLCIFLMYF